jgi:hypothetical protein
MQFSGEAMAEQEAISDMHQREIKLSDGRYLIFYTFDDAPVPANESDVTKRPEPAAEPEAGEERHV